MGGEFLRLPESLRILKSDKREKIYQAGRTMRVAFLLFVHLLGNVAKLVGPGGSKGLLAETLLVKHQLIVLNRSRRRGRRFNGRSPLGSLRRFRRHHQRGDQASRTGADHDEVVDARPGSPVTDDERKPVRSG